MIDIIQKIYILYIKYKIKRYGKDGKFIIDCFIILVISLCIYDYHNCGLGGLCKAGHPELLKKKKGGNMDVLLTGVVFVLALFVLIFAAIGNIKDAKIEINRELCKEKIRYTKEKADIEIKALEEKKKKGLYPFSLPPQK